MGFKIETADHDDLWPTQNQTKHCYSRYCEYWRCHNKLGEGAADCDKFRKAFRSLCPTDWTNKWDEQRENGTFAGPV